MPVPTKTWADGPFELINPTKSGAEVGDRGTIRICCMGATLIREMLERVNTYRRMQNGIRNDCNT